MNNPTLRIELVNMYDEMALRNEEITSDQVRRVELIAEIDHRSTHVSTPKSEIEKLGLKFSPKNNDNGCVSVNSGKRFALAQVLASAPGSPVLLGERVLEWLDLKLDPERKSIVPGHPDSPDVQVFDFPDRDYDDDAFIAECIEMQAPLDKESAQIAENLTGEMPEDFKALRSLSKLLSKLLRDGTDLRHGMTSLLTRGAKRLPDAAWDQFKRIDFQAGESEVEQWLDSIFIKADRRDIKAFYFWVCKQKKAYGRSALLGLRLDGYKKFNHVDDDWRSDENLVKDWRNTFTHLSILKKIQNVSTAILDHQFPFCDYFFGSAFLCLAIASICKAHSNRPFLNTKDLGVVLAWDEGDYYDIGYWENGVWETPG